FVRFIIKPETNRFQTGRERNGRCLFQWRCRFMCFFQFIVWHPWTKVMYMVIADAASQPLQYFRQLIVRTSINGSFHKIPFIFIFEVGILKLMLYIKEPNS